MRVFVTCLLMGMLWTGRAAQCLAQSTTYIKTMDDPKEAIDLMINISPLEGYIPSGKYSQGALLFGANGIYGITSRLGFEASAAFSYFNTKAGEKGPSYYQAGGFLHLFSKEKVKKTRVILSYKRYSGVYTRSETVRYMEVPAKVKIATGIRGGIDIYNSTIVTDGIKIAKASSPYSLSGIYAGIQTANKHLIKTKFAGATESVPTSAIFRLYADVLFYPESKLDNPVLAAKLKPESLGYRGGINYVPAPYGKKNQPSRYNPILKRTNMLIELGSRPLDGFFVRGGVSWGIVYR
jgi:hypothetical protein